MHRINAVLAEAVQFGSFARLQLFCIGHFPFGKNVEIPIQLLELIPRNLNLLKVTPIAIQNFQLAAHINFPLPSPWPCKSHAVVSHLAPFDWL